jgi:dolichol-phosphate mannosyltransferase
MPILSVVIPVYGADSCVPELCKRLQKSLSSITQDYEIILVEDRSPDTSWSKIIKETELDSRVRGVRLSRNFGQHRAITAGLDIADGDWVVVMDCDLQDPPEAIPELYSKALEGHHIVMASFEERKESWVRQFISKIFWLILSRLAGFDFDFKNGNFRIMSRLVVQNFRKYREQLRLLGGINNLMGFTKCSIKIERQERHSGKSSYTLSKLLSIAFEICMAYSDKPLKLAVGIGLSLSSLSVIVGIYFIYLQLSGSLEVPGWASLIVSTYLVGGLILASIGVLGYYLGRVFDEVKNRPLYLIEQITSSPLASPKNLVPSEITNSVIWITGLSGAGKSTLAKEVANKLQNAREKIVMLDGDEMREVFGNVKENSANHGRTARLELAMQYAKLCRLIATQGTTVICSTISMFREVHEWNRENIPGYFEVYLKVPLSELRRRDPKGIYRRFNSGVLKDVAGLDLEVDEPQTPDILFEFDSKQSLSDLADEVIKKINIETN